MARKRSEYLRAIGFSFEHSNSWSSCQDSNPPEAVCYNQVVDALVTAVSRQFFYVDFCLLNNTFCHYFYRYDNEYGYSCRVVDLIKYIHKK